MLRRGVGFVRWFDNDAVAYCEGRREFPEGCPESDGYCSSWLEVFKYLA